MDIGGNWKRDTGKTWTLVWPKSGHTYCRPLVQYLYTAVNKNIYSNADSVNSVQIAKELSQNVSSLSVWTSPYKHQFSPPLVCDWLAGEVRPELDELAIGAANDTLK